jgi:hypothetical protein
MDDDRDASIPNGLTDRRAARRTLLRVVGGALLITLTGDARDAAQARPPRRRKRKRHPIACDPRATSGIVGLVLIGPTCPVVMLDDPCPDRPVVADLVVRTAQGTAVCTTASREDGRFRIGLPPGAYELDPTSGEPGRLPYAAPQHVTVKPGQYTEVRVAFDSGIR